MATTLTPPPAAPAVVPASALAGRGGLVQFTVDDVHAMLRAGMVAEDATTELLDGYIVHTDRSALGGDPTLQSPGHRYTVRRLTALAAAIDSVDRHVQIQLPIVCGPRQMPEPDFAVIRGKGGRGKGDRRGKGDIPNNRDRSRKQATSAGGLTTRERGQTRERGHSYIPGNVSV